MICTLQIWLSDNMKDEWVRNIARKGETRNI
jgi:hypothetical protein